MTVITLVPPQIGRTAQESAQRHLEAALERVKSGETVMVAIAEITKDNGSYTHWSHIDNINLVLGALSRLTHKINELDNK